MNPPAYAACSLGVPAIRREDVDDRPKGDIASLAGLGEVAAGALAAGSLAGAVLGAVALGVAVSVGEGVGDAVSLGVGVGVAVALTLLLAEGVGLGVGAVSARATDGIPKVSARSANGAVART